MQGILDVIVPVALGLTVFLLARHQPVGLDGRRPPLTHPAARAGLIVAAIGVAIFVLAR